MSTKSHRSQIYLSNISLIYDNGKAHEV